MGAALDDAAGFEHQDLVGVDNGREAVRDDQRRAVHATSARLAWISRSVLVSSAEVASSKIRICGAFSTTRAIATRCFSPPESFRPRSPTIVS